MSDNHGIMLYTATECTAINGVFVTSGNGQAIQGHIEKVVFTSTSWGNGSIFLIDKATGEIIYGTGNVSGASPVVYYPRVYVTDNLGVSISGANRDGIDKRYVNGPIIASGLGLGSVAGGTTGTITIYYY